MSRIGARIIKITKDISININNDIVFVKGPLGVNTKKLDLRHFDIIIEDLNVFIKPKKEVYASLYNAMYGTLNSHVFNMIQGVQKKFEKKLKIVGVAYRCFKESDTKLKLQLGFSHDIFLDIPKNIELDILQQKELTIKSCDKELLGLFCAKIRHYRTPDAYRGKGVRYADETIILKEGKKSGK